MEFDAAVSSHSHQASWSGVTILQSHMSLCPDSQGSKPTNCSCESGWAGPCWDMEPGLGNWPAKLRKLVSCFWRSPSHQLLREITVTLRTLRPSQRLASLQTQTLRASRTVEASYVTSVWTRCGQTGGHADPQLPVHLHTRLLLGVLVSIAVNCQVFL